MQSPYYAWKGGTIHRKGAPQEQETPVMIFPCKVCGALDPEHLILIYESIFSSLWSLGFDFAGLSFLWYPRTIQFIMSRYHPWHFTPFLLASLKFLPSLIQILPHPHKKNLPFSQDIQPCKNEKVMKWRRVPWLKRIAKCFAGKKTFLRKAI